MDIPQNLALLKQDLRSQQMVTKLTTITQNGEVPGQDGGVPPAAGSTARPMGEVTSHESLT